MIITNETDSMLMIVNYHYIRERSKYPYAGIHPVEWQKFIKDVRLLSSRFHMATPEEVERFTYGDIDLPGPSVFLSFDDGLVDHATAAQDVLDPLGIKAVFSISSRPLIEERALMVHKIHWLRATTPPDIF